MTTPEHRDAPPKANDARTWPDLLENAWTIIANVDEGNGLGASGVERSHQTAEWREAAARWRDDYHVWLKDHLAEPQPLEFDSTKVAMLRDVTMAPRWAERGPQRRIADLPVDPHATDALTVIQARAEVVTRALHNQQVTAAEMGYVLVAATLAESANQLRQAAQRGPGAQNLLAMADELDRLAVQTTSLGEAATGRRTLDDPGNPDEYPLVQHARRELALLGEGPPEFVESVVAAVRGFCLFGHSGGSAETAIEYVHDLLRWRPLTPLTRDPAEWEDRSDISGIPLWQSKRDPRAMSTDGGRTYWLTTDEAGEDEELPRYTAAEPKVANR
jgi:hypothetical protein